MNNSSDFMMYLHNERVQRMRQEHMIDNGQMNRPINRGIESPFARVRSALSTWVGGDKNRDINQS